MLASISSVASSFLISPALIRPILNSSISTRAAVSGETTGESSRGTSPQSLPEVERLEKEFIDLTWNLKYDEAAPAGERALAAFEKVLGPDEPRLVKVPDVLQETYRVTGNLAPAQKHARRAVAIAEESFGPESVKIIRPRTTRAWRTTPRKPGLVS